MCAGREVEKEEVCDSDDGLNGSYEYAPRSFSFMVAFGSSGSCGKWRWVLVHGELSRAMWYVLAV